MKLLLVRGRLRIAAYAALITLVAMVLTALPASAASYKYANSVSKTQRATVSSGNYENVTGASGFVMSNQLTFHIANYRVLPSNNFIQIAGTSAGGWAMTTIQHIKETGLTFSRCYWDHRAPISGKAGLDCFINTNGTEPTSITSELSGASKEAQTTEEDANTAHSDENALPSWINAKKLKLDSHRATKVGASSTGVHFWRAPGQHNTVCLVATDTAHKSSASACTNDRTFKKHGLSLALWGDSYPTTVAGYLTPSKIESSSTGRIAGDSFVIETPGKAAAPIEIESTDGQAWKFDSLLHDIEVAQVFDKKLD